MRAVVLISLTLLSAGCRFVSPAAAPGTGPDSFDTEVEDRLRSVMPRLLRDNAVPGVSVALVRNGAVAWTGAFGEVDPGAVFEAASLSKPLFAYGVLLLVDDGRLDLDAPLRSYLDAPYADDPRLDRVTASHVLSHTSGLPNWSRDEPIGVEFEPGTRWQYSGEAYVYLQRVVERITRQSLEEYMASTVLEPLGLRSSSFVWRPDYDTLAATGHDATGAARPKDRPDRPNAAHSLHTTAADYARFLVAALDEDGPAARMAATRIAIDPALGLEWGLGWGIERVGDRRFVFHWGANDWFRSFAMGSLASGDGIVVLTNGENGLELMDDVVEIVTGEDHPLFRFYMLHPN